MFIDLPHATLAVGALGAAATGLVDSCKAVFGGISRAGFSYITELIERTVPAQSPAGTGAGLGRTDVLATLLANWINGMDSGAQKVVAKSLIKMHFNPATAPDLAKQTNLDPAILTAIAVKLATMASLTTAEADVYGRFDFSLSALVDQAYERGDQFYRNFCKALASVFAVLLAVVADWSLTSAAGGDLFKLSGPLLAKDVLPLWGAVLLGLIATPVAPVAKDIANAIQTASDTLGVVKGL